MKKHKKINVERGNNRRPPKAKVARSNRAGCTNLPLPKRGQVIEIPEGYEVLESITCRDFVHKRTLFIRQIDASLFENDLNSRRVGNHRARSA